MIESATRKRILRWIFVCARAGLLVFVGVSAIYWCCCWLPAARKGRRHKEGYRQIQRGMTQDEVTAIMGEPDSVKEGAWSVNLWDWEQLDDETARKIDTTFRYAVVLWPSFPTSLITISFDKEGRAVGKHEYY